MRSWQTWKIQAALAVAVASLGAGCGHEGSSGDDGPEASTTGGEGPSASGGAAEGGAAIEGGGPATASGGVTAGSGATPPGSGGAGVSGEGGDATGGTRAETGGAAPTGGRPASGGAGVGGAELGGGAPASGAPATGGGSAGGSATGGDGSGGDSAGASAGGASAGAAATGGAPVAGSGGTGGFGAGGSQGGGGSGERVRCGAVVCDAGDECCGPPECGLCINPLSGANCPDTCPGAGGAGGSCTADGAVYALPELDRTCATSNECFLGVHTADCCGSVELVAYRSTERERFVAYEAGCQPACACMGQPAVAEDGSPISSFDDAVAECVSGRCIARGVDHVGECLDGEVCIDVSAAGDCVDASGPVGVGRCRGSGGLCFDCDCAAPDTPIATPDGERPISELARGDLVYSVDGDAIVAVPLARVNRTAVFGHQVVEVTLGSGRVLRLSALHPTADGRLIGDLSPGGSLDGERVVAARTVPYALPFTYDILPASSTGAYFAGGVLVGSTLK